MCIIVDANAVQDLANKTDAGRPVLKWLFSKSALVGLVIGGKLTKELVDAGLGATLRQLSDAGRLHRVNEQKLSAYRAMLEQEKICKSNDLHVVALTLLSNCPVVFSRDKELGKDLHKKCPTGQKIAIYKSKDHSHLLTECKCPKSAF